MQRIPFSEINDEDEFWKGAIFIRMGNRLSKAGMENYYEYMLFLNEGVPTEMLCAHIGKWDAGAVIASIKLTTGLSRLTVKAKDFKWSMISPDEIESWYYVEGEKPKRTRFEE